MQGVLRAVELMDDLNVGLLNMSELHAFILRVDPGNFKILSHNILVVFAILFPDHFIPEVHVAMEKFLSQDSLALTEKYR
ncbi:hemoglobin subunit alpha-2-like [Astyanax mexicanus]|uniref:Hemoglobin subunit alpha-2-like n=1 Tax=Astyanax mexicanus TaxID=7994 RepID=A0A8T2MGY4_ASTMX|nr:hemoglobin subunit alpha-2-like [Astyanax mexicanus]